MPEKTVKRRLQDAGDAALAGLISVSWLSRSAAP